MINVGIIGFGCWGKTLNNKLFKIPNIQIKWVCNSQDKWWKQEKVDWVIIASPNEFHYEQAKYFLKNNVNVFCEKPGTLCFKSLEELIELSKNNNLYFYIDDVLIYEDIIPQNNFIYKKWGGPSANIIDRMAYHHFYLIYNKVKDTKITNTTIIKNKSNHKIFEIEFSKPQYNGYGTENEIYKFEYDFNWHKSKIHNIKPQYNGDALEKMLINVLHKTADFNLNLQRSLFATKLSEHIKSKLYGKCAVVGAGIYGITAATKLKTKGFEVDLFEAEDDI